ncbi:Bifunctional DNA primase/polymerase, N-terminal [Mycobacteroides abscessus subsp. abscessus]|uniref:bifunctional DNA primase/polymerase n=1 Tax=Mycobacteroides abscessus TaxID=36809 RepID=UPI0009270498|nr:bifunctional DNA primase/polymerase [Mycobacteroides abscessus]SHP28868.1 Bifunctional DNA primase/polymerase, N-terminal [Mycobacteroides abscessus subsp. abscessus]SHP69060.1 Bifunctional DNA primase/polymerase, N-terminal [Mycobacteroides abscessus subsp. abscessus]SHY39395.1 Bifunctional DNA primase/polymerase, N-terminal [Mycobacteroides abscessus subsp. abscessus]SKD93372.1 Bifunctional DNA primase/polymerase, N-terminal [Mycobacteroides abscessus subsp. abscessus]
MTHRYAMDRETATAWVDFHLAMGAHLIPLRFDGTKFPLNKGYHDAPPLTREAAIAHRMAGGGLGIHLGRTGWVGLDADNAKATALFQRCGFELTVVTANAQVPDHPKGKFGGGQVLLLAPEGYDPMDLHFQSYELPTGEKFDLLGGRRYIVAAGTQLDEAGGCMYLPSQDISWDGYTLPRCGAWIADAEAPGCPTELEVAHGGLSRANRRERVYDDGGEWRTMRQIQIDEKITWEMVLDCPEGQRFTLTKTDSCGCDLYAHDAQTTSGERGMTGHDGCAYGYCGHFYSGTIRATYGLDETTDKLRIAARLRHLDTDGEVELGRKWGIDFGGLPSFADALDEAADKFDERAETPEWCTGGEARVLDPAEAPEMAVRTWKDSKGAEHPETYMRTSGCTVAATIDREYWIRQAAQCRELTRHLRSGKPAMQQADGETFLNAPMVGAEVPPAAAAATPVTAAASATETETETETIIDAETVEVPGGEAPSSETAPAIDDAIDGELVGETDKAVEARKIFRELRPKIKEIERQMALLTPGLKRAADFAESRGIYMHGFVGAILPSVMSDVPPNVMYPPFSNQRDSKSEGQGINCFGIPVGPSSSGKTVTASAAKAAIPLKDGVVTTRNGTSESWSKKLRGRKDGEDYIKATSLIIDIDEVLKFNTELERIGSKTPGWIAETYQGTGGGQDTSDEKGAAVLPDHGSRIGIRVNAQPGLMGTLLDLAEQGAGHRFYKALVGLVKEEERGALFGVSVPAVKADQSAQPWYTTLPVGYPPIACQQPQKAREAAAAAGANLVPDITNIGQDKDGKPLGIPGYDNEPPIWIDLPPTAQADMAAGLSVAMDRGDDWGLAMDQDAEGTVTGHRVTMQKNIAFAFAVLDGEHNPRDEHWEAAGLFLTGSDLVMQACVAYMELRGEADALKAGHLKGVGYAAAKAAETTITSKGVHSAMNAIITRLTICGGSAHPGHLKAGSDGKGDLPKFGGMSKGQKNHAAMGAEALSKAGLLRFEVDGRWTLIGRLAVAA